MGEPVVRKFLDLSTSHLPEAFFNGEEWQGGHPSGVVFYPMVYGGLLWVPDSPKESSEATAEPVSEEVQRVQLFARELGCDYVLFDADGDECDGLPTFEWESGEGAPPSDADRDVRP